MSFLSKVKRHAVTAAYQIEPLDKREYVTLEWLCARGYGADILSLTQGEELDDGGYRFDPIPEHVAWEIREKSEDEAFLTSNGSRTLAEKLNEFLDKIV